MGDDVQKNSIKKHMERRRQDEVMVEYLVDWSGNTHDQVTP